MSILRRGIAVQCRTQEEAELFIEVATAEGHKFAGCDELSSRPMKYYLEDGGISLQIGFEDKLHKRLFPNDVSMAHLGWDGDGTLEVVEASQLFRNYIISRRIKNGSLTE